MNEDARRAWELEAAFLAGVEANLGRTPAGRLPGTSKRIVRADEFPELRSLLGLHGQADATRLQKLPSNRRITVFESGRRWLVGRRPSRVLVASVLVSLEQIASGGDEALPPVGLGELVDHVRGLVTDVDVPHWIGVCSPSGFAREVRESQLDLPDVALVLVEPDADGGWRITGVNEAATAQVQAMFDPRTSSRTRADVRRAIEAAAADQLTGGLAAEVVASRLGIHLEVVVEAFHEAAQDDPELRVKQQGADTLLLRSATDVPPAEAGSVFDWIRSLFGREGEEAGKINLLSERRAGLMQRRERLYAHIAELERHETDLLASGREAPSMTARRRIAGRIAHVRRENRRLLALAEMITRQIEILSTDIHSLSLIQQGRMTSVPDAAELTENAVRAQEMLERFRADADLAAELEAAQEALPGEETQVLHGEEERAILGELGAPGSSDADEIGSGPQRHERPSRAAVPPGEKPPLRAEENGDDRPVAEPES